eukprot:scaffold3134_cov414-Prasinococcus_capsulatus_cf.AAC.22
MIGRCSRFMNAWRPPAASMTAGPGCRSRWYVLQKMSSVPEASAWRRSRHLGVALVATMTKAGVSTVPCGVWRRPTRAWLRRDRCTTSNPKKSSLGRPDPLPRHAGSEATGRASRPAAPPAPAGTLRPQQAARAARCLRTIRPPATLPLRALSGASQAPPGQ